MSRRHKSGAAAKRAMQEAPNCTRCGQRLGKHRYGDDACPNPQWVAGNGKEQWLRSSYSDDPVDVPVWGTPR